MRQKANKRGLITPGTITPSKHRKEAYQRGYEVAKDVYPLDVDVHLRHRLANRIATIMQRHARCALYFRSIPNSRIVEVSGEKEK